MKKVKVLGMYRELLANGFPLIQYLSSAITPLQMQKRGRYGIGMSYLPHFVP